jgi:hypothetical protein
MRLAVNDKGAPLEKLILNVGEYKNSRINSREIYFNGNLYDVKSVTITGDRAELLVINDLKEKFLLQEIKDFLKKSNQSKKELPDQLQKLLSVNYIATDDAGLIYLPSFYSNIFSHPEDNISSNFPDNPSPPPKFC